MGFASLVFGLLLVASANVVPPSAGAAALESRDKRALTDAEIRQILIRESIEAYPGTCPCPYSMARNGSRCGKRSAYSRPGGEAPLCYERDVSPEIVRRYRDANP